MNFGEEIDDEEDAPEIEQPELEEIFQTDLSESLANRERKGEDRVSPPFLGKQAKSRLIAARTSQLRLGANN
jgi:hypothetical protein